MVQLQPMPMPTPISHPRNEYEHPQFTNLYEWIWLHLFSQEHVESYQYLFIISFHFIL